MNLNQITIPSVSIEEAIVFYQTLGLTLIVNNNKDYARFTCPDGTSTFSIHKVDQLPSGSGIMVYFECEKLDEKVDDLMAKGIQFDELPNDKPWLWREARLRDLDNNQIVLFYAGGNRINPPWRIQS